MTSRPYEKELSTNPPNDTVAASGCQVQKLICQLVGIGKQCLLVAVASCFFALLNEPAAAQHNAYRRSDGVLCLAVEAQMAPVSGAGREIGVGASNYRAYDSSAPSGLVAAVGAAGFLAAVGEFAPAAVEEITVGELLEILAAAAL